jgi:hypothetical protein
MCAKAWPFISLQGLGSGQGTWQAARRRGCDSAQKALFEMLIGQVGENGNINVVLGWTGSKS